MVLEGGGPPWLSIVVPTLNEEFYLGRLLQSLAAQTARVPFEVRIVDSSSNPRTRAVASGFQGVLNLSVHYSPTQNAGHQRNVGWESARAPLVLFLDADVVLSPGLLGQIYRKNFSGNFVASIRHTSDRPTMLTSSALIAVHLLMTISRACGVPVTNGDFILTSRETLEAVGGFAEGYILGEDTYFGICAGRLGAKAHMIWSPPLVASARRLDTTPTFSLVYTWVRAFLRAFLHGPTPAGQVNYPFGLWGSAKLPSLLAGGLPGERLPRVAQPSGKRKRPTIPTGRGRRWFE